MDFNYLSVHQDELLIYLRTNNYAETYINRYRTIIKQITTNADEQKWQTYEDVYQWYVSKDYSTTYLHELRAIIGKLELFHLFKIFPDGKKTNSPFRKIKPSYSKLNAEYRQLYDDFENIVCAGIKESTVKSYKTKISSFLYELQSKGVDTLSDVTGDDVLSCFFENGIQKIWYCLCKNCSILQDSC